MSVSTSDKKILKRLTSTSSTINKDMACTVFDSLYTQEEQGVIKTTLLNNSEALTAGRNKITTAWGTHQVLSVRASQGSWGSEKSVSKLAIKKIPDIAKLHKDILDKLAARNVTTIDVGFSVVVPYMGYGRTIPNPLVPYSINITFSGTLPSSMEQVSNNRKVASTYRTNYKYQISQLQEQVDLLTKFLGDG